MGDLRVAQPMPQVVTSYRFQSKRTYRIGLRHEQLLGQGMSGIDRPKTRVFDRENRDRC